MTRMAGSRVLTGRVRVGLAHPGVYPWNWLDVGETCSEDGGNSRQVSNSNLMKLLPHPKIQTANMMQLTLLSVLQCLRKPVIRPKCTQSPK